MKVTTITAVGAERPPCSFSIRVAAGLATNSARYGAAERRRKGIPVDQCGERSSFMVDGAPLCRAHAGQVALKHVMGGDA